jgi:hypothetical protein
LVAIAISSHPPARASINARIVEKPGRSRRGPPPNQQQIVAGSAETRVNRYSFAVKTRPSGPAGSFHNPGNFPGIPYL